MNAPADHPAILALPGRPALSAFRLAKLGEELARVRPGGAIDVAELAEPDNLVGIANTAVVWGSQESPIAPAPFDDIFPAGVHDGLDLHRITEGGAFEPAPEGVRFELRAGAGAL